jgi:hypothetical protein
VANPVGTSSCSSVAAMIGRAQTASLNRDRKSQGSAAMDQSPITFHLSPCLPTPIPHAAATSFRIPGICPRRISKNASAVGLLDPRGRMAHRHKALDCTVNGRRIVLCCSNPRAQAGANETPSPLSTRRKTVVIRSVSCRTFGEKPALPHNATTSSNKPGAPIR